MSRPLIQGEQTNGHLFSSYVRLDVPFLYIFTLLFSDPKVQPIQWRILVQDLVESTCSTCVVLDTRAQSWTVQLVLLVNIHVNTPAMLVCLASVSKRRTVQRDRTRSDNNE